MTVSHISSSSTFAANCCAAPCWTPLSNSIPGVMVRNPVMFVVEVGSLLTTLLLVQALLGAEEASAGFMGAVAAWLWFTVLFANFAEALAEGRGKAQAEALRRTRHETPARKAAPARDRHADLRRLSFRPILRQGDVVLVEAGDIIPADGEVIEGIASVDESAVTGESAPVIRESGGDRSAVTGGTRVLSDWLVVRISCQSRRGLPGPHDQPGRRSQTTEDAQRNRPEYPAGGLHDHLSGGRSTLLPFSIYSVRCRRAGRASYRHGAGRAAGLPDPDHHWRLAERHRHRRHGSPDPA